MPPDLTVHLLVPSADGGRLLVDGRTATGTLPIITPDIDPSSRLVTAVQRHLRASWHLEAVILETHLPPPPDGAPYVGLAVLEPPPDTWRPPPGHEWAPAVVEPPNQIAARAGTWIDELATGGEPPALRPRWARPGWTARATTWIDEQLDRAGRARTGPYELWRLWSLSAMIRLPTDAGEAWFKAVFPHFQHEPAVTSMLAAWLPDLLPPVIASESDEGWLLLEAAGSSVPRGPDGDAAILDAIDRLVGLQEHTRGRLSELGTAGCPHRPLRTLAVELAQALAEWEALGGEPIDDHRPTTVVEWVRESASWLDGLGMPEVLVHGDFHPGNLLADGHRTRIIDWSDAAIAHPALDIGPWFGEVRPELRPAGWRAWTSALEGLGPVDELRGREADVYALACAYQVVSYAGILRGVEPANRYQLADGLNGYWRDLEAHVPRGRCHGIGPASASGMDDQERDQNQERPPIDESTYGGSAAETGGLYHQDGPTRTNPEGDTMSEREERGDPPPESHTDG